VRKMHRVILMFLAGGMALAGFSFASSPTDEPSTKPSTTNPADQQGASLDLPPMPPAPTGESTIMGGAIRNVDPVLDRFKLYIPGASPMTILFDERTQVFRDGVKIPLRHLAPADHVSVQTALDGTHVFAESIHILSRAPEGETRGMVKSFDSRSGKLTLDTELSPNPVKFYVAPNTPIDRVGQPEFTSAQSGLQDLKQGSLVTIAFSPDPSGRAVVHRLSVLAVPGSAFVFGGNVTYLDLASGSLVLANSRDGKNYRIYFDPNRFRSIANLRIGENVTVTADFEGTRYVASAITIN